MGVEELQSLIIKLIREIAEYNKLADIYIFIRNVT